MKKPAFRVGERLEEDLLYKWKKGECLREISLSKQRREMRKGSLDIGLHGTLATQHA